MNDGSRSRSPSPEAPAAPPTYRRNVDFRITADEERVLFVVVGHLNAGSAPTAEELSRGAVVVVNTVRARGAVRGDQQCFAVLGRAVAPRINPTPSPTFQRSCAVL